MRIRTANNRAKRRRFWNGLVSIGDGYITTGARDRMVRNIRRMERTNFANCIDLTDLPEDQWLKTLFEISDRNHARDRRRRLTR